MDRAEFEAVVDEVLAELPEWVVERIDNLHVVVEERPTRAQIEKHGNLLGLYEGVSLTRRGPISYAGAMPDRITIFRGPHLRIASDREQLRRRIATTVVHEVGHHIGISYERHPEQGWA